MNKVIRLVKDLSADCCISIILNTHRTHPDNAKDSISLKNLVREAETRIKAECKDDAKLKILIEKMNKLADSIDHNYNLESLVLYINDKVAEFERLPISVTPRVVVSTTFATRDLLRALHKEANYYVLVLGREKARLIEAFNDQVVREFTENFPLINKNKQTKNPVEAANAIRSSNLQKEFFNQVDKKVLETIKDNPHKILISTEDSNYSDYLAIADNKNLILGNMSGARIEQKAHQIITDAWKVVSSIQNEKIEARGNELTQAENSGKVVSDLNDIWKAVKQGRGQTLFVKKNFFQPVILENDTLTILPEGKVDDPGFVDDIIDDIIEFNIQYGGDYAFLEGNELDKYNGIALAVRY